MREKVPLAHSPFALKVLSESTIYIYTGLKTFEQMHNPKYQSLIKTSTP
jgi:hypothetical protein